MLTSTLHSRLPHLPPVRRARHQSRLLLLPIDLKSLRRRRRNIERRIVARTRYGHTPPLPQCCSLRRYYPACPSVLFSASRYPNAYAYFLSRRGYHDPRTPSHSRNLRRRGIRTYTRKRRPIPAHQTSEAERADVVRPSGYRNSRHRLARSTTTTNQTNRFCSFRRLLCCWRSCRYYL